MENCLSNWILFGYGLIYLTPIVTAQIFSDNTPPVIWLDRTWRIPSTESVGTVVTRVNAQDNEHDILVFGLESLPYGLNAPPPAAGQAPPYISLPFRIDNATGVVYVNESLKDRAGQNMFLYVTATDGKLTAKSEVWVNIMNGSSSSYTPSSPNRMRPPFLSLPPGFSNRPPPQPPPSMPPLRDERPPPEHPLGTPAPRPVNKTLLQPVITNNDYPTSSKELSTPKVIVTTSSTTISDAEVEIDPNSTNANITGVFTNDLPVESPPELSITLIFVLGICAVFLTVGLLAVVFRKKIYFGRTKNSKEDMAKEPNGGIVLQEDPSLAMQNWRGPRAFSNRYEPWDPEGNLNTTSEDQQIPSNVKTGDRWEFPRHRLKIFNILGEGAFGQVWKCEALDIGGNEGTTGVAVKTLKENATERERSDLLSELNVMKSLGPHPNVVRLLGCCTEREPFFVIMEFVGKGRLQTYLRESRAERHHYGNTHGKSGTLTGRDLTSFVHQVARGMQYLVDRGIVHRDLAARNVLISEDHTCKVADFGFARDVTNNSERVYERKSEGRLPIRWMAPESLYDNVFTCKSDVWSFGVLMWEVVTLGSTPYPGLSAADVMRKVRDGHRLDKPEHCRRELYNIMYYCWDQDPDARPGFSECVELLEKLLVTETDYIELERFPDHSYYNMVSLSGEKL